MKGDIRWSSWQYLAYNRYITASSGWNLLGNGKKEKLFEELGSIEHTSIALVAPGFG